MHITPSHTTTETNLFSPSNANHFQQNDFVNRLLNQIEEKINKLELKEVFADLKSLCGGKKNLKFIKDEKSGYLCIQMLFSTIVAREIVKKNLFERSDPHDSLNLDQWQEFKENNLEGLTLSYTQSTLMMGRGPEYVPYMQRILEKIFTMQQQSYSLTKIPVEFLSQLCTYLPIKTLNLFSETCKKIYELVQLNENSLLWINVAEKCKIIVEFDPDKSIKKQIIDPWLSTPFGKINQLTYEVKVNNSYRPEPIIQMIPQTVFYTIPDYAALPQPNESEGLYSVIFSFFKTYIPADYYLIFDLKDVVGEACMLFYRDQSGTIRHDLFASIHKSNMIEIKNLSKTYKCCVGSFEEETI